MESVIITIVAIISLLWMFQMLKLTRENRIINSMILKILLKKMEQDNVKVDINDIQKEILNKM